MAKLPLITDKSQIPAEHQAVADTIIGSRGSLQGPFSMFLHSPELAGRVAHLGTIVRFEGTLDFRARTIAAMVVAREFDALYVWGAQTSIGRQRGIPEATIAAIRENRSDGIPPDDLLIVDATRQLLRAHRLTDATRNQLLARFGADQFIQLTTAIGYYSLLAMTVNACEVEPAPGADVLPTPR
jgi:4-carboxymuconolactone decarboxylase